MKEHLWFVGTDTGYVGCTQHDVYLHEAVSDQDEELSKEVWEIALENAQSYGIERYCGQCEACEEGEFDECEDQEEGIEGWAELYDPKQHDKLRAGGGSFLTEHEGCKFDEELNAYYVED